MYFTDRGLEELADRRGEEQVTLAWLADQMQAFVDQFPDFEVPVERLATWLARGGTDDVDARSSTTDSRRRLRRLRARLAGADGVTLCTCSVTRMPCRASPRVPRRCPGPRSRAPSPRWPGSRRSAASPCCPTSTTPARRSPGHVGPVTDVPSGAIGRLAQGHRWGTHDAVLGPLAFGRWPCAAAGAFWSSLLLMALAIGLALRALHFVIPGRAENTVVGNLVLSWGGAWLLLAHSPQPGLAALGGRRSAASRTSPATRSPRPASRCR